MALEIESVNPPTAIHLKDGDDKSMMAADLEDGEIEDGEIPDEEGGNGGNTVVDNEPEGSTTSPSQTSKTPAAQNDTTCEVKPQLSTVKPKRPTLNRSGGLINHRHVDRLKDNAIEDDWAGDVEKAIKAAMNSKESEQDLNSEAIGGSGGETKVEEEDERKIRRKKRKKKHREDDEDRKDAKKRKRNHGGAKESGAGAEEALELGQVAGSEDEDDDDEMLFVRGASPIMRSGFSPPGHNYHEEQFGFMEPGGPFEDPYDSFCDDSDYEREDFVRPRRGDEEGPKRGRGAKRRPQGRGAGRGIQNKRQQGGRKDAVGVKGKRIGNKRQQQRATMLMQDPRQGGPESICMFYMQGKCQKGEECPYSHDAMPPRKMELCKFYLMDCCAKKDKCLYMHSDFPCKFYHTGLKCFAGDRCKFSHGTLTETLRAVLLKHLETAPKEILGDFPRLSREGAAAMVYNKKNRGNKAVGPGNKKIPSLFEIEVPIPAQLLAGNLHAEEERSPARRGTPMPESDNEDQDGCRTPMPSSPRMEGRNMNKDFTGRSSNRQWDADDGARPGDSGDDPRQFHREPSEEREPRRSASNYQDRDFSEQLQQLKMRFYQETLNSPDEAGGNMEVRHHRHRHRRGKKTAADGEEQTSGRSKLNLHRLAGYSPAHATDSDEGMLSHQESKATGDEAMELADEEGKLEIDDQREDEENEEDNDGVKTPPGAPPSAQENKKEQPDIDHNSSCSTETGGLPLNLPKKQRELFLRIQQQQREAADSSSQDQSGEDEGKDADVEQQQEENWYSSDEEEASLADVLKNLSKQQQQQQQQQSTSPPRANTKTSLPAPTIVNAPNECTPALDISKLSDIDISESVSKLLSSIRNQQTISAASAASTTQAVENTDPRLPLPSTSHVGHTPSTPHVGQASSTTSTSQAPSTARDPRLVSRDPRNRSSTSSSMSLLSPTTHDGARHDPRTSKRSDSTEERRTSIYSSAITSPSAASTSMVHGRSESGGDIDLRSFLSSQQKSGASTDIDLRQNMQMRASASSSSYTYGDTDLRGQGAASDVDLRGMLGLPFKPVPMHTPATEIDASLTSHPPIPYKVVPITIPRPDYSGLKLNTSDPQVRNDPRLRKLFKMSSATLDSPASPPPLPPPPPPPPPKQSPRSDPRRRSAPVTTPTRVQEPAPMYSEMMPNPLNVMHNAGIVPNMGVGIGYDMRLPRNPRNAPGLLGPAPLPPNYCPNTPRFEDGEEGNSNGSDTDLRMFYGRMGNAAPNVEMQPWDQQSPQAQGQRMHRSRNWRNNRRSQQRFPPQSQPQEQQRSFTPPL